MTLQQLQYFLTAVKHRSFSAAAAELHLAQPSLSEQIKRLEQELGVELFARGARRLELTEAGRTFRPHAERTLADAAEAIESVREVRALRGGTMTFGTFGNAPYFLIADLVESFRRRHPDVNVRLIGLNSSQVASAVREGRIEAALVVLPVDARGLDIRPAVEDELLYLTSDPERVRRPVTIEGIANCNLVLSDAQYGWEDPTRRQLAERAQLAGLTIEPVIEVENVMAALELAARGVADAIAAGALVSGRGFGRRLHSASFDPPILDTFAFITRRNAQLSPATRAFMAIAERRISQLGRPV